MVDFTVVSQKKGPIFKSLATRGPLSVAFACFPCVCVGSLKILQLFSTEGRCRCMLASNDCLFLCVGPVVAWPPLQEVPWLSSYGWMELFEWEKGIDRKVLFWSFFSFNLTSWFYISVVMQSAARPHTLAPFICHYHDDILALTGPTRLCLSKYAEANGNQPSISHKQKYVKISSSGSSDARDTIRKLVTSLRYSCVSVHHHSDEAL